MHHVLVLAALLHAPVAFAGPDADAPEAPPATKAGDTPAVEPAEDEECCPLGVISGTLPTETYVKPPLAREYVLHGSRVAMEGQPTILGALDRYGVEAVVDRYLGLFHLCYREGVRRDPALQGRMVVKLVIGKDGSVSSASKESSTLGDTVVEECVVGRVREMRFRAPKGGGLGVVQQSLEFAPASQRDR